MTDAGYLQVHHELLELHRVKSAGYGTGSDAFANFTAVAELTGEPAWRYPRRRALEKLTRLESLDAQGRLDELGEEHKDIASLMLSAEALRRRHELASAEPSSSSSHGDRRWEPMRPLGSPLARSAGRAISHHPGEGSAVANATTPSSERLRELAAVVQVIGLSDAAEAFDVDRDAAEREIAAALLFCSDLIGPEALAEGPYVARCEHRDRQAAVDTLRTLPANRHFSTSDPRSQPARTGRGTQRDLERYGWHRTATAVARHVRARLRDALRGGDGRVRA